MKKPRMLAAGPPRWSEWRWLPLGCFVLSGGCSSAPDAAAPGASGSGGKGSASGSGGAQSSAAGSATAGIGGGSAGANSAGSGSGVAGGAAVECVAPTILCQGQCTDTRSDPRHCGGCDKACAAGDECSAGACQCPVGQQRCGDACANLSSAGHCGSCDKVCKPSEICAVDACISSETPCPNGLTRCGDACVDLQTAVGSCGACDIKCSQSQVCSMGSCTCPKGAACESAPLLLAVGPTKHYLVSATGSPFQLRGDAPWTAPVQLTRENVTTYLDDRQKKHFNTILIEVIEDKFGDKAPSNAYGDAPFTGGDFTSPSEPYWKHIDYIVSSAAAHGIVVLMCPLYLGFGGGDEGWYAAATKAGAPAIQAYGAFLGARYKASDNVVWVNGGDFRPPTLAIPNALATGILSKDSRHLFTTHWGRNSAGTDGNPSWLTLNSSYTDQASISTRVLADYQANPPLPTFLIESEYEGSFDGQPTLAAKDVRIEAWQAILSGASGYIYGNHTVWPFDAGWPAALDSDGARQMANMHVFFSSVHWWGLVPDASSSLVTAGRGANGTAGYVTAAAAADGTLGVVYIPGGGEVTLSMAKFHSSVRARWFDPVSAAFSDVAGSPFAPSGTQKVDPPGASDSVLLLEAM